MPLTSRLRDPTVPLTSSLAFLGHICLNIHMSESEVLILCCNLALSGAFPSSASFLPCLSPPPPPNIQSFTNPVDSTLNIHPESHAFLPLHWSESASPFAYTIAAASALISLLPSVCSKVYSQHGSQQVGLRNYKLDHVTHSIQSTTKILPVATTSYIIWLPVPLLISLNTLPFSFTPLHPQ